LAVAVVALLLQLQIMDFLEVEVVVQGLAGLLILL
jgi:hypothetical protein